MQSTTMMLQSSVAEPVELGKCSVSHCGESPSPDQTACSENEHITTYEEVTSIFSTYIKDNSLVSLQTLNMMLTDYAKEVLTVCGTYLS